MEVKGNEATAMEKVLMVVMGWPGGRGVKEVWDFVSSLFKQAWAG